MFNSIGPGCLWDLIEFSMFVGSLVLFSNNTYFILAQASNWQWKFKDNLVNIYYEEYESQSADPPKDILMIPTISDVSTVEEWRIVARELVQKDSKVNWRATIVDWPGLGFSDRPKMDYNADVMEKFLVDLINAPDGPVSSSS